MRRDPAIALFVLLLAGLALPATGWVDLPLLPSDPAGFFRIAAVLTAFFLLAVAAGDGRSPWRPLAFAIAALPFFVFCALEAPGAGGELRLPSLAFLGLLAVATIVAALRPRTGTAILAVLLTVIGGGAVLAEAGVPTLPSEWNPWLEPAYRPPAEDERVADAGPIGHRIASPTRETDARIPALAEGAGPWWVRAQREASPGPKPLVVVFDGSAEPAPVPRSSDVSFVHGSRAALDTAGRPVALEGALDLAAFDAVVVYPRAGDAPDEDRMRRETRAILGFLRRGGLLIGPPPGSRWPALLARRLGDAGRSEESGPDGARRFGLGRVVRAAGQEQVLEILGTDLWVKEAFTAFDRTTRAPPAPDDFPRWSDDPRQRRPEGLLLVGYGIALLLFSWALRGGGTQVLSTLLCVLTVAAGLVWVSPQDPGFRTQGLVIEIGGVGGRRIEALWVSAGPAGFQRTVTFEGGGFLSRLGSLGPFESGWILREGTGLGLATDDKEDRFASGVRPLLRGQIDPKRLRYGRIPALPVRVDGLGLIPAVTLRYKAP